MWTPTHVQVTIQRAKGLLLKGKNGTNDAFVTISLGKEKYQTSVKERVSDPVDWHEECELAIPRHGNKAEIVLTVLHRNFIGDEFLGQVSIPLSEFDVYDKAKNRWYNLRCKPGQDKKNYRGEIEVRVSFTVQSGVSTAGSLSELKKDGIRASFGQLSQKMGSSIGGSLLSLKGKGDKKGLKSFAKAVGSKVNKVSTLPGRGHKKKGVDDSFGVIPEQLSTYTSGSTTNLSGGQHLEADPGVISDDEDEFRFDELSHKSSHSSLSVSQIAMGTPRDGSLENLGGGEFLRRNLDTSPPGRPNRLSDTGAVSEKPKRWSAGPVDDWEVKLFGKQQTILDKASSASINSASRNSIGNSADRSNSSDETNEDKKEEKRESLKGDSSLKPTFQSIFSTSTAASNLSVSSSPAGGLKDLLEPLPKPRQSSSTPDVTKSKSEEKVRMPAPQLPVLPNSRTSSNLIEESFEQSVTQKPSQNLQQLNNRKNENGSSKQSGPLKRDHSESSSDSLSSQVVTNNGEIIRESPVTTCSTKQQQQQVSLVSSLVTVANDGVDEVSNNQKWTPVGITNPIRQKESHQEARLPREVLKRFENKSREDLIELIMKQQSTLEYQKQKLNDMEDYIDNLLVRVMENKPTLLQTPFVAHRSLKFSADTPEIGDWFALSD